MGKLSIQSFTDAFGREEAHFTTLNSSTGGFIASITSESAPFTEMHVFIHTVSDAFVSEMCPKSLVVSSEATNATLALLNLINNVLTTGFFKVNDANRVVFTYTQFACAEDITYEFIQDFVNMGIFIWSIFNDCISHTVEHYTDDYNAAFEDCVRKLISVNEDIEHAE